VNCPTKGQRSVMSVAPAPEASRKNQYLQVEEFHFLHNDMCSNSLRGGQEQVVRKTRLST